MAIQYQDKFGFLPSEISIEFNGGKILPLDNFDQTYTALSKYFDSYGSFCPPENIRDLYKLQPTHELILNDLNGYKDPRDIRLNEGGFIIHLVAYIFGVRTQFHDWWFDSRIPSKCTHNLSISKIKLSEFISYSYDRWRRWSDDVKKLFANILYMNSRVESYHWEWEKFIISYMVLDGCYKCSEILYGIKGGSHATRINCLRNHFNLMEDKINLKRIVKLRNQLFHETLWSDSQPCTAPDGDALTQVFNLHRFNQRLIIAILGFKTDYIKSSWTSFGTFKL